MDPLEREQLLAPSLSNRLPLPTSDALLRPPPSCPPTPPLPRAKVFSGRRPYGQSPPAPHPSPSQTRSSPLRSSVKKAPLWRPFGGAVGGRPPLLSPRLSAALVLILFAGMFAQVYFSERWRGQVSAKWKVKRSNLTQPHAEAFLPHQEVGREQRSRWRQGKGRVDAGDGGQFRGGSVDGVSSVEVHQRGASSEAKGRGVAGKKEGDSEGGGESTVASEAREGVKSVEQPRPQSAGRAAEVGAVQNSPASTPSTPPAPRQQADGGSAESRQGEGEQEVGGRPFTTARGRSAEIEEKAVEYPEEHTAGGTRGGGDGSAAELAPDELEEAVSLLSYTVRKKRAGGGGGKQSADPEWEGVFAP